MDLLITPCGKFDNDRLTGHHSLLYRPKWDDQREKPALDALIERNPRSPD
jgi:hypothetical protein